MRPDLYCICGTRMHLSDCGNHPLVARVEERFWARHSGDGHGPCTQAECNAAERRRYRAEERASAGLAADGEVTP